MNVGPKRRTEMKEQIRDLFNNRMKSLSATYENTTDTFYSHIPDDVLKSIRDAFKISAEEDVLFYRDTSSFNTALNGLVITTSGVYWNLNYITKDPIHVEWSRIQHAVYKDLSIHLLFSDGLSHPLDIKFFFKKGKFEPEHALHFAAVLTEIAELCQQTKVPDASNVNGGFYQRSQQENSEVFAVPNFLKEQIRLLFVEKMDSLKVIHEDSYNTYYWKVPDDIIGRDGFAISSEEDVLFFRNPAFLASTLEGVLITTSGVYWNLSYSENNLATCTTWDRIQAVEYRDSNMHFFFRDGFSYALDIKYFFKKKKFNLDHANHFAAVLTEIANLCQQSEIQGVANARVDEPSIDSYTGATSFPQQGGSMTTAEQEYLTEYKECLASKGGEFSDSERRLLERMRKSLGISVKRAAELEDSLTPVLQLTEVESEYLEEYKQCAVGGNITDSERRLLDRMKKTLGISDERAAEIESSITI